MRAIAYETPSGLSIYYPAEDFRNPEESEDDFLNRAWARHIAAAKQPNRLGAPCNPDLTERTAFVKISVADLPADKPRASWRIVGGRVVGS